MDLEQFPPLTKPFDLIAANLANEGVPVMAIARSLNKSFMDVRGTLTYFIELGTITDMPQNDWPATARRADRLPLFISKESEKSQLITIQRALKLTRLQASFMLVLLKRDEADKDVLHYVIESQRSLRRSRPDNPETTDPKMVDVVICNLRKRLKPFGFTIATVWGLGYFLPDETRTRIEDLLDAVHQGSPAPRCP
jgi:hypothetical protein